MTNQLAEAQYYQQQIRESYRHGHRDGVIQGLKRAFILYRDSQLINIEKMQDIINREVQEMETKNV